MVYRWQVKQEERFLMDWAGKIVEALGVGGAIFTLYFDQIARGTPFHFGWLQIMGVIGFVALGLFGVALDRFLQTVKDLLAI